MPIGRPNLSRYRPPIPGVRHSHGPGFGVRDRVRVRDRARVRVRRTVGMADPGNGGPEPFVTQVAYYVKHDSDTVSFHLSLQSLCTKKSCRPYKYYMFGKKYLLLDLVIVNFSFGR